MDDIINIIYKLSDIDTKLNIRKAFKNIRFIDGKVPLKIDIVPIQYYLDNKYINFPINNIKFNELCQNPKSVYISGYVDDNEYYTMYWNSYRICKSICHKCNDCKYSTFTCNKSDYVMPGFITMHKRIKQHAFHANNWLGTRCRCE